MASEVQPNQEDVKAISEDIADANKIAGGADPLRARELELLNGTPEDPVNPDIGAISDPNERAEIEDAEKPE